MKHTMKLFSMLLVVLMVMLILPFAPLKVHAVRIEKDVEIYEGMTVIKGNDGYPASWAKLDTATNTIKLMDNVEFPLTWDGLEFTSGSWTLDLNGKYIKGFPAIQLSEGVELTIIGSGSILGNFLGTGAGFSMAIDMMRGSSLTIRGGDITIRGTEINRPDNDTSAIKMYYAQLSIESGNVSIDGKTNGIYAWGSTVNISGGNVTINGGESLYARSSTVNISGGNVTISGDKSLSAISGTVNISGGVVNLGASKGNIGTYNHTDGVVYDQTTNTVTAKTINQDYTIPANATLTVAEEETLTLTDGAVLTVDESSTLVNNGIIDFHDGAKLVNNGTFTNNGSIYVNGARHDHALTAQYTDLGDGTHQRTDVCIGCPIDYADIFTEGHDYDYRASGNTVTEYCVQCKYSGEATLEAPRSITYNGSACEAAYISGLENTEAALYLEYYTSQDESLGQTAPADVGTYTVKMWVSYKKLDETTMLATDPYTFTISPRHLEVTGAYAYDKTYDGTRTVEISEVFLGGVVDGDDVTAGAAKGVVETSNVGDYTQIDLYEITLAGADCGNYTVDSSAQVPVMDRWGDGSTVSITPAFIYIDALEQTVALGGTPDQTKWELDPYSDLAEGHMLVAVVLTGDTSRGTQYSTVKPTDAVIHDAAGNDVTNNYLFSYRYATMAVVCPDHDTFKDGFCTVCSGYQQPVLDPGEEEWEYDDVYLISNAGQLFWFAEYINKVSNEAEGKLMTDITVPEGKIWTPMKDFYATFDGNFKTVSGLYVKTEDDYVGMFGGGSYSYGTIKNLRLSNCYFEGADYVGGIAGYHAGTIENCYVDGTVTVKGGYIVGALVGSLGGGMVSNCYAYSDTLIGRYNSSYSSVINCYYLSETDDGNGGKTAAQFASGEVAYLLQAGVQGEDIYDEDWNYIETIIPEIWGQSIGKENAPVFGGKKVYQAEDGTYNNGEIQKFDIDVARMILGNALEFQFGVATSKIADTTGYYAVIEKTWADGTTTTKTIPATQWGTVGPYYAIVYDGLAAKEMADTFYVTIYNADGVAVSNAKEDSVVAYVERAYASQTATGKTMMVDMLNYGAAAQTQFSYGTDNLANSNLTDEQKAVGTAEVAELNNNQVKGTNYLGTRFILQSRIQVQLAFKNMTTDMYAVYTYTKADGTAQEVRVEGADFVVIDGNPAGVELSALVYADARNLVTVTVYNADGTEYGSAVESIESCAARSSGDVFTELMKFADSAKAHVYG